ncbi:MAG: tRNA (adenosine(37)-N6)-dimethylallyltransferase MiaA, partial [Gammaproteobacteria bacterium]|nr:tRNA (adenosine(37)-N6)-dimethylallyltransferase MiaA [Gammaproteobacteria bacterium]
MAKTTPKVLCILGPTASGKTELALHLARKYNGEIVNVDSAQVYRHMDIGTAKVERAIRAEVPHHLLDIREPFEGYSASDFCADATEKIHTITARGRLPILAGGTMLYFKALFEGLADMPGADQEYRDALERRAEKHGWPALHAELLAIDPDSASRIKPT